MSKIFFVTDVEATGPDFARHNMYQFACVPVLADGKVLDGVKYDVALISDSHDNDTMAFLKKTLNITPDTLKNRKYQISALDAMGKFDTFVGETLMGVGAKNPVFAADNLAFDWGYVHTYFHRFLGRNPFGYAGRNIPCMSLGFYGARNTWEKYITQRHTHDALDDTTGNAGALSHMIKEGLHID